MLRKLPVLALILACAAPAVPAQAGSPPAGVVELAQTTVIRTKGAAQVRAWAPRKLGVREDVTVAVKGDTKAFVGVATGGASVQDFLLVEDSSVPLDEMPNWGFFFGDLAPGMVTFHVVSKGEVTLTVHLAGATRRNTTITSYRRVNGWIEPLVAPGPAPAAVPAAAGWGGATHDLGRSGFAFVAVSAWSDLAMVSESDFCIRPAQPAAFPGCDPPDDPASLAFWSTGLVSAGAMFGWGAAALSSGSGPRWIGAQLAQAGGRITATGVWISTG